MLQGMTYDNKVFCCVFCLVIIVSLSGQSLAQAPILTSISPTVLRPGMQVTLTGSGFGATQNGSVTLQNSNGVPVVSWSDTQIVVTVPTGITPGNAYVWSGDWSNGVAFDVVPPTLTSISPTALRPGMQVTLTGSGFGASQGSGAVELQNKYATVVSWSDTQIVVTVPDGTIGGTANILQYATWSNGASFTMIPAVLSSISPTAISPGRQVTLAGSGFGASQGSGAVELQNKYATVVSWSDTQIVVTVPDGTIGGTANILQYATWSNGVSFTIQSGPALSAVSPSQGAVGAQVTITGTGFGSSQGTNSLTFNGTTATATNWAPTSITALVPSGSTSGNVVVTVGGTASNAEQFTVITPSVVSSVSPSSGAAGTQVTISGSGFGTAQASGTVWLGSTLAPVVSWSPTQIVATVSSGSSSGVAKVQQNGLWSNSLQFSVNNATIASISPTSGLAGTQVTIVGSGFGTAQGSGQVWLGTANGIVTSWSDGQVIATVASGSASGNAQILQNGVWSNAIGFNVNTPLISSISPSAGAPGTSVTVLGSGFGTTQGSGSVTLGTVNGLVTSWSDSQVVAQVASGSQNGTAQVSQNGSLSNSLNFSVPASGTSTNDHITPGLISMVVGDTRSLQVLDVNGAAIAGLTWSVTDSTIASLSSDDPPILTALAVGKVTISAGDGSASLTVYPGPALQQGTIQWSDPGDGSGVVSIVPAVPSSTGVADVFALQADGNVQAIANDGTVAWTAQVGSGSTLLPDFQGGLVIANQNSVQKFNGMTGQAYPAYTKSQYTSTSAALVHTDGTIFTAHGSNIIALDGLTGTQKFSVPMEQSSSHIVYTGCETVEDNGIQYGPASVGTMIIAGDGYAYIPYTYSVYTFVMASTCDVAIHNEIHARIMRVGTDGSSSEIVMGDWSSDRSASSSAGAIPLGQGVTGSLITNADQGVLYSWADCVGVPGSSAPCVPQHWLTSIPTTGSAFTVATALGSNVNLGYGPAAQAVQPMLQMQDGSFIGTMLNDDGSSELMVDFDQSGNQKWSRPGNYQPQIATADGGLIATSPFGQAVTFDANGNSTGQMASLPTQSWNGNEYQLGPINLLVSAPIMPAATFGAFPGGNASPNGTAIQQVLTNQSQSDQKQLPNEPPTFGNINMLELSTDKSPDYIFQHYLETFIPATENHNDVMNFSGSFPVTGAGQTITISLRPLVLSVFQGPFSISTERVDPASDTIAVVTLKGHPLAGWRYWRAYSLGTNDVMIETGAYDGPGPGLKNFAGYFIAQGSLSLGWRHYLEYIQRDLGASRLSHVIHIGNVPGNADPQTMLGGFWDYLGTYTGYILNNVCQASSCN